MPWLKMIKRVKKKTKVHKTKTKNDKTKTQQHKQHFRKGTILNV